MSNEVMHKNASIVNTGCSGCMAIIIIVILIGAYIYLTDRADKKVEPIAAPVVKAVSQEKTSEKPLVKKEEESKTQPQKENELPKLNTIEVEGKTAKPVEEKTVIAPKVDNFF